MNNEIQIITDQPYDNGSNAAARQADWSQGPTAPAPQPQSIFMKMHKLLRGRYPVAIVLALVGASIGAAAGWLSKKPLYQSVGIIAVKTTHQTIDPLHPEIPIADASSVIATARMRLASPDMIRAALGTDKWAKYRKDGEAQIVSFLSALDVEYVPGYDFLKLTFSDADPKVAQAGMNALCEAWDSDSNKQDPDYVHRQFILSNKLEAVRNQINDKTLSLSVLTKDYKTTDLEGLFHERQRSLSDSMNRLGSASVDYSVAKAALDAQTVASSTQNNVPVPPKTPVGAMSPEIIASSDQYMRNLLNQKSTMEIKVANELSDKLGPNNVQVVRDEQTIKQLGQQIAAYAQTVNAAPRPQQYTGSSMQVQGLLTQADVDQKQKMVELLKLQADQLNDDVKKLGEMTEQVRVYHEQISRLQLQYDDSEKMMNVLETNRQLENMETTVKDYGSLPVEPSDHNRIMMAAAGFMGGGVLPVAILMLVGLLDGRYRFSDETGSEMAGLMMLGMLPNLPDLLSDPEQAATAAHCVHQIRTMLQINGHVTDRRVYAITSASSGDGKTSLTLALGLSFAASGSRTLLIDADLVGGGLTSRLGVRVDHGVLEAMASTRRLEELTRATDVTDLSILPVGLALGSYTGAISPVAVRRLIAEARKSYDTILIDTGPILGSIEASPVAASADGVIICVARGQQRSLVDRALLHLQSIGARFAGMVFNRAQAQDFERSVSRMSLHSVPQLNGNGHARETNGTANHIGPVAKAVASSVRSTVGSSDVN